QEPVDERRPAGAARSSRRRGDDPARRPRSGRALRKPGGRGDDPALRDGARARALRDHGPRRGRSLRSRRAPRPRPGVDPGRSRMSSILATWPLTMPNPPIALRNVVHGGRRSVVAIAGVAFAVMMVLLQLGFYQAVKITATHIYEQLDFDVVLLAATYDQFF